MIFATFRTIRRPVARRPGAGLAGFAMVGLALGGPAAAATLPTAVDLEAVGWRQLTLPGKSPTRFAGRPDGAIEVRASDSASFLYMDVSGKSEHARYLSWRWRVEQASAPTDLTRKGADDRPLALHVWFPERGGDRDPWELLSGAVGWAFDVPVPGKVLTYVWGGRAERGVYLPNPYLEDDGMMVVLRPGDAPKGRWFEETIDIAADFEMAFGYAAPPAAYVAVSADFDDTKGTSMALIADIMLTARPASDD